MIISASRRTDIPAFFGEWFIEKIDQGFIDVQNPYNKKLIRRVSLMPVDVDCIVFWTRNPKPFFKLLPLLQAYTYYFLFTLTPYGSELEPKVPEKEELVHTLCSLSEMIGKERVIWRYDPIIYTASLDTSYHIRAFETMTGKLMNHTQKCVISFLAPYRKTVCKLKNFNIRQPEMKEIALLLESFTDIGKKCGIEIASCASDMPLKDYGVMPNRCIDNELISKLTGKTLAHRKDKSQRISCGCHESIDIGTYNTCRYECLYCYANG
ncbi:MAG: DUF1848 domain-containing protein [Bacteroidales bacterium]|nr:DUF1848 domain-containing protein [Bacteroidales bacterium]